MKKLRKISMLLLLLLTAGTLLCGFDSEEQKVYDDADLLTEEEEAELQDLLVETAQRIEQDLIIVTTDDAEGKSSMEYADDFFDEHGFGYEKSNGSGVLYLIDMDNRQIYISTAGTGIEQYTDNEIESTLDVLYEHVSNQDYYGSCTAFVKEAEKCLTGGESADNGYYDSERESFVDYDSSDYKKIRWQDSLAEAFRPGTLFMNLGIAAVIAGIITLIISHNRKTQTTVSSRTYLKQGSLHQNEHTDFFTHTTVVTRKIEHDNNNSSGGGGGGHSSSHSSSSGASHGGGGRSF